MRYFAFLSIIPHSLCSSDNFLMWYSTSTLLVVHKSRGARIAIGESRVCSLMDAIWTGRDTGKKENTYGI